MPSICRQKLLAAFGFASVNSQLGIGLTAMAALLVSGGIVAGQERQPALQNVKTVTTQATDSGSNKSALIAPAAELQLVAEDYQFTEGPAADSQGNVYFTDQPNDRILKWSTDNQMEVWLSPCGRSNGLFFDRADNLIACADEKNQLWKILPDKSHSVLLDGFQGKLFNGPNDVWVAGDDALYFTDPFYRRSYWQDTEREPQLPRRVYRLAPDLKTVEVAADGFQQPNGIVGNWSRKVLYVADIGAGKTYQFRIASDGSLTDRSLFCAQGSDGMTLDEQGNLYLTGKGVTVYNAAGEKIAWIDVPERWTANICFGGKEKRTLFITASDSLYTLEMQVRGL